MERRITSIIVAGLFLAAFFVAGCATEGSGGGRSETIEVTDFRGRKVTLPKHVTRIMTLSRNMDTMVLGMRKSEDLVAADKLLYDPDVSTVYKKAANIKNRIFYPTLEEIYALKPEVVFVGIYEKQEVVDSLSDMGIQVVCCGPLTSIAGIQANIRLIAQALSEEERGEQIIAEMDRILRDVSDRTAKIKEEDRKSVVLISIMATYGGIGSAFDDMCRFAHVRNRMAEVGLRSGMTLPKEVLIQCNPDILLLPNLARYEKYDADATVEGYLSDPAVQTIRAVRNKAFRFPRHKYMYAFSQDIVFGLQELAASVYGDDFLPQENAHISFSGE